MYLKVHYSIQIRLCQYPCPGFWPRVRAFSLLSVLLKKRHELVNGRRLIAFLGPVVRFLWLGRRRGLGSSPVDDEEGLIWVGHVLGSALLCQPNSSGGLSQQAYKLRIDWPQPSDLILGRDDEVAVQAWGLEALERIGELRPSCADGAGLGVMVRVDAVMGRTQLDQTFARWGESADHEQDTDYGVRAE